MVSVALFGAGPGLYLDLSRLSFQVPTLLSAPQAITVKANTANRTTVEVRKSLLRMFFSFVQGLYRAGLSGRRCGSWLVAGTGLRARGFSKEFGGEHLAEEDAEHDDGA